MVGLQTLALQNAEPNFDLIEPGRVGRQPVDLEVQTEATDACLRLEPVFQLFGCVGGAIVQNEDHVLDAALECFRKDHLLHKGLEIDKTFVLSARAVDLAIGNGEASKQVARAATVIARFVQERLAILCWARRLLAFAGLNGGFFHPG